MNNVTRWWWVRHAPVPSEVHGGRIYGQSDVPCDCSDAAAFAGLARLLPSGALWVTSQLRRARDTAEAIRAAGLAAPDPLVEPDFAEQDFGDWQGTAWDELRAADQRAMADFWKAPALTRTPNGESFADLIIRVAPRVVKLTGENPGRDIVIVAHGGTIRAAIAHAIGLTPDQALSFRVDNLSVTRLDHVSDGILGGYGGSWRASFVNGRPR